MAAAILQRSGGGTVTWGRYILVGRGGSRCFSSQPAVPPPTPAPLLLLPTSPISPSSSPPELRPQLVLPGMFPSGKGSMNLLMAVPKKKVSPYKKGLRNGPKALKPVPVIVRCKSCGRVRLPHFYCCSGDRGSSGKSESIN